MKKGFTLIELLAVIVILAIIAVIAVPIVLNIINDTKESAVIRSADFYIDALENEIALENMKVGGTFNPSYCDISSGNITCEGKDEPLELKVDGEVPTSGRVTFENGKVTSVKLIYQGGAVTMNNKGELVLSEGKACTLKDDKDKDGVADTGDMIICSTESFHVISNDGEQISMLAQYNLDVGQICDEENDYYEQITNPTGVQNENAIGLTPNSSKSYGTTIFSAADYWYDVDNNEYIVDTNYEFEGREYPFVYGDYKDTNGNQQNEIYPYIKSYEEYLIKEGVTSAKATLISHEQLIDLGCSADELSCALSQYDWTYSTSYWTGSAFYEKCVWYVRSNGLFDNIEYGVDVGYGVRPVVNISVNEL